MRYSSPKLSYHGDQMASDFKIMYLTLNLINQYIDTFGSIKNVKPNILRCSQCEKACLTM